MLIMLIVVMVGFLIPTLRTPSFYYWDDTIGAAVGVWQRIGSALLEGRLPFLEVEMWRGGNLIGEAATGMWNPVMAGLMMLTYPIDNLAVAITLAKLVLFVIQALGIYVLVRGFNVGPWWAALAGAVIPLSGWAIFIDGTAWINATAVAAFLPWAWWGFRRAFLKRFSPSSLSLGIVMGFLLVSTGNPYSVIVLAIVGLSIAVEAWYTRQPQLVWWIAGMGSIVAALVVIVYLPFALTSQVGFRADSGVFNDESLSPNLNNFLGMSAPVYAPWIQMFGRPMMSPGVYLAWFVLPMLPWLRWRVPKIEWPPLAGLLAFSAFFLFFALGPSQLWMFRWPGRLIPFLYLGLFIIFVILLERGFRRDKVIVRVTLSFVAVGLGAWIAASDQPRIWKWIALATFLSLILLAVVWFWGRSQERLFVILSSSLLAFIGIQVMVFPNNGNVANYNYLQSRSQMQENAEGRYKGLTVQVTRYGTFGQVSTADGIWRDFFPGNMSAVIGLESTTGYSGIGFSKLDEALGMAYNGAMGPESWNLLWSVHGEEPSQLADLIRAETVVVQRDMFDGPLTSPQGWVVAEESSSSTIYRRVEPLAYPDGRLSYVGGGITVDADQGREVDERVVFQAQDSGDRTLIFARLAWPGYSAMVNGKMVEVITTHSGLVSVTIPEKIESGVLTLRWSPPGLSIGLAAAGIGLLSWAGIIILSRRRDVPLIGYADRNSG